MQRPRSAAPNSPTPEKKRGVGIALGIYGCGLDGPDGSEARVELTPTGVTVYNAWEDHGQGADLGTLTMAHEVLRAAGHQAGADQAGDERHHPAELRPGGRQPLQRVHRQRDHGRGGDAAERDEEAGRHVSHLRRDGRREDPARLRRQVGGGGLHGVQLGDRAGRARSRSTCTKSSCRKSKSTWRPARPRWSSSRPRWTSARSSTAPRSTARSTAASRRASASP